MKIYNTMTRKLEEFKPLDEGKIRMYVCGPTVYDVGHLGHGMSAVFFDVIRRYFLYKGFDVTYVMNYTDVEDKIIKRAAEESITTDALVERVIPMYEEDYGALGIKPADHYPRCTEYIDEMVGLVGKLEKKGFVYVISDGVYFDVSAFKDYGKLSGQDLEQLREGVRVEKNAEKRSPHDFVLWKFSKEGEPSWKSPWGDGRPGWHIECSAMSSKLLGETFDIHGGGIDLMFPHHECEIAQSEGANGAEFARYWLHNGHIRIDKEKMSKSLGNFFTLRDIFKEYDPQAVRLLYVQSHYRSPVDFSKEMLTQAVNGLARLHDFWRRVQAAGGGSGRDEEVKAVVEAGFSAFEAGMDSDFDTSKGLAACFDLLKALNKILDGGDISLDAKEMVVDFWQRVDSVLGVLIPAREEVVSDDIESMIREREQARVDKDYARSDEIRDELLEQGIVLEDTPNGTVWKRQ